MCTKHYSRFCNLILPDKNCKLSDSPLKSPTIPYIIGILWGDFLCLTQCDTITSERNTMRTLALSDEILMKVDKAARYIGGEVNSVMKDKNDVDIRFAMCFPDVYEMLFLFDAKTQYIVSGNAN